MIKIPAKTRLTYAKNGAVVMLVNDTPFHSLDDACWTYIKNKLKVAVPYEALITLPSTSFVRLSQPVNFTLAAQTKILVPKYTELLLVGHCTFVSGQDETYALEEATTFQVAAGTLINPTTGVFIELGT